MIFNKIVNIKNKILSKRLDARREKIAKDWSFLTEHDCDCHDSYNPHVEMYTMSWLNPATNKLENITAEHPIPNKKSIVTNCARNLDVVVKGANREQAQRAANWLLREHNKQNLNHGAYHE